MLSSLLIEDIKSIIKVSRKQLLGISILIGFLLFLLNILLSISLYAGQFSDGLKSKLGMYFYIKDTPGAEATVYRDIMSLKDELQSKGLRVMFSSKEDSFAYLQKKVPNVVENLQKFGIENPLPATLYVMFDNESQYQILRSNIIKHKDIILNIKDISQGKSLKQQENRILTIINFTNFIKGLSYVLITVLGIIILAFLVFLIKNIFHMFRKDLEIKKLLGATHRQITEGFVRVSMMVLSGAFALALVLILLSSLVISFYVYQLFDINMWGYIGSNIINVLIVLVSEIVLIMSAGLGLSYAFLHSLNKEI